MSKKHITTPIGTAVWPHLHKPDMFKGAAKYKIGVEVSKQDAEVFKAKLLEMIKDEKFETKKPKLPIKEEDGVFQIRASSSFAPMLFDSRKNTLSDGVSVGGGSKVRVLAELYNYGDGISLRLKQVQVIELREWTGECNFDEIEDGYVASEEAEFEDDL